MDAIQQKIKIDLRKNFQNPKVEYRSAPFWSWNDNLKDKELQNQLLKMKQGGMGGAFLHSRIGLITPYLSKEWMERIKNTIVYAKKIGLLAYLYDEDRWPSGFAGGLATKNKKYRERAIKITPIGISKKNRKWKFEQITIPPSKRFNNCGSLDTLSKDAVREFIKSTYEAYKNIVGEEFDKTVPAIFTDEPNYLMLWGVADKNSFYFPWTDGLDEEFFRQYGYDVKENLKYLIENTEDYKKIRYHFFKLVTGIFVTNYGKQIYDWCEKNNISFAGHYLAEDTLASQTRAIGAAMPFYEYMHIPGIDHLARQIETVYLTIKQCSSVAHQLGRKRVLSEIFGCSGQNMSFLDRKWIGNWNTVLGINLFCPHLWLYSMAGCRKRDFPPALSYQQPYWKYNKIIEDYFARINYITSQGSFCAGIVVLHPIESAWCLYNPSDTKPVDKLNDKFISMLKTLSGEHYDYDLCDESLLTKYGKVSGISLEIGEMSYKLAIIPSVVTLRKSTVDLLNSFLDLGGKIIGLDSIPEKVDGEKDKDETLKKFYSRINIVDNYSFIKEVSNSINRNISIIDEDGNEIKDIYYQHRIVDTRDIYFLININKYKEYKANVKISKGKISPQDSAVLHNWDPATGEISVIKIQDDGDYIICELYFPQAGSYILVKESKLSQEADLPEYHHHHIVKEEVLLELGDNWECMKDATNLNSLTIDYCQYKTGKSKVWSDSKYVLDIQNIFEEKLKNKDRFCLKYSFRTGFSKKPDKVFLILERPEQYNIKINGIEIGYKDIGFWIDISFKKVDITNNVKLKGENYVELESRFRIPVKRNSLVYVTGGTEVESVYILGNFNVKGKFKQIDTPLKKFKKIKTTGWSSAEINSDTHTGFIGKDFILNDESTPDPYNIITSGYPFYAGNFVFSQEVNWNKEIEESKRIFLSCDKVDAITLKVSINKKEIGVIVWQPYNIDIAQFLNKGKNLIEIEITNSLRNLLGPHHFKVIHPEGTGPGTFNDKNAWVNYYTFVPFGLGRIKIVG